MTRSSPGSGRPGRTSSRIRVCRSSRSKDDGAERHPRGERAVQLRRLRDHRRGAPRSARSRERPRRDRERRLRGDRAGTARLSRGPRLTLRKRLEGHGLALVGGYIPIRFSEPEHWTEDLPPWTPRSICSSRRWNRSKAGTCRRGLGGANSLSRPRRGRPLDRPRRGRVGAVRGRRCTGRRTRPHTWLRSDVPPPRCDVRRGAVGDRARPRAHRRRSTARHRASEARRRRSDDCSARLGQSNQPHPHQGRARRGFGGRDRRRGRHAGGLAPRRLLRARDRRCRSGQLLRRARALGLFRLARSRAGHGAAVAAGRRRRGSLAGAQPRLAGRARGSLVEGLRGPARTPRVPPGRPATSETSATGTSHQLS